MGHSVPKASSWQQDPKGTVVTQSASDPQSLVTTDPDSLFASGFAHCGAVFDRAWGKDRADGRGESRSLG